MKHFSTFSQRPSPQAPRGPVSGQELIMLVSCDKVSSRYDQMAPHSCPFLVSNFDVFLKPRSLPPLPRKIHGRKDGKHHLPSVFVLNHLYPIFPPVPFVCIVWDKGQKASRHIWAFGLVWFSKNPPTPLNRPRVGAQGAPGAPLSPFC